MDFTDFDPASKKILYMIQAYDPDPCPVKVILVANDKDILFALSFLEEKGYVKHIGIDNSTFYKCTMKGTYAVRNLRLLDDERKKHLRHNWRVGLISALVGGLAGYVVSLLTGLITFLAK